MPSESFQTAFVRYSGMHKKVMRRVGWVDKPNVSDGPWAVWFLGAWASFVRTITLCFNKANRTYACWAPICAGAPDIYSGMPCFAALYPFEKITSLRRLA